SSLSFLFRRSRSWVRASALVSLIAAPPRMDRMRQHAIGRRESSTVYRGMTATYLILDTMRIWFVTSIAAGEGGPIEAGLGLGRSARSGGGGRGSLLRPATSLLDGDQGHRID